MTWLIQSQSYTLNSSLESLRTRTFFWPCTVWQHNPWNKLCIHYILPLATFKILVSVLVIYRILSQGIILKYQFTGSLNVSSVTKFCQKSTQFHVIANISWCVWTCKLLSVLFWIVMPHGFVGRYQHLRETYHLHLQG